jgi:transcriptional regulator of arginine metabolism
LDIKEIVGTIAGDNTIFVLVRTPESAEIVMEKLKKMMK